VGGENAEGMIKVSADGSKLAYLGSPCQVGSRVDVVVRDAGGGLVGRWPTASAGGGLLIDRPSLSPDGRLLTAPDPGCVIVQAEFQPRTGRLAAFERCLAGDPQTTTTPPRFRLVYLDPSSGRLLSRSLTFDDDGGADLTVASMDFDQSGRHLLYWVSSHDPMDSQKARPATGTWRYSGGTAVRIQDDRRDGSGYRITTRDPTW
jgi:hypothetical protein